MTTLNKENLTNERLPVANTGLVKVAVQCSAGTFVVNQSLVLRINICGENCHHPQFTFKQIEYDEVNKVMTLTENVSF